MRILMVTEDIPAPQVGGLGKHVVTLANALIELGHEVVLMGRSDRPYDEHAEEIGFNGRFLPGLDLTRAGWKEAQLGVWMPYKRPALAKRIERAIQGKAGAFDVVHYHGHLPMVGASLPGHLNFVQTRHDQGSECLLHTRFHNGDVCKEREAEACGACIHDSPGMLRRIISTTAVRQYRRRVRVTFASRKTIFVSDFLRRNFELAVPDASMERSRVIHNFIDLKRLNRNHDAGRDIQPGSILLAGRIDAAKGFDDFLRALEPGLASSHTVLVVGDGPDRSMLEARFRHPSIRFLGWRSYDEVARLTFQAHVCVVPSKWEEPCGTTIIEALAAGRPCLALRRGGTPELRRYERYPGQLQLAESMTELAHLAVAAAARVPMTMPLAADFGADISHAVPRILDFYAEQ